MQQTLVLLKPDCVQRRLVGRVLTRFEDKGLSIVAMKMRKITPELARQHYAEHVSKPFYAALEAYITSAPVVAAVIEGIEAIAVVRQMLGPTSGLEAPAGTLRGDFSTSRQMNLVHASDSPDAAQREIGLYFDSTELISYQLSVAAWLQAADEN